MKSHIRIGGIMVTILKALADENRIRLLNVLFNSELCVCEIEAVLELSQSNASRHLTKLKSAKIISSYKKAQWVYYKLDENFKENHSDLVKYLKDVTFDNEICKNDLIRLNDSDVSCENIVKLN